MDADESNDIGGPLGLRLKGPLRLAMAQCKCWHCGRQTAVAAISAAAVEDLDDDSEFAGVDAATYIFNIGEGDMPTALAQALAPIAPRYTPVYSRTLDETTWANVCEHCGMLQGAFFMHSEPDGPFFGSPGEFNGRWIDLVADDVVVSDASFTDS